MRVWRIYGLGKLFFRRLAAAALAAAAVLKLGSVGMMAVSMLLSAAVYASAFGWRYALGFVLLLFAHEAGHILASRVVGIPTSPPLFIPFIGAVVRLRRLPASARMEANVAIGGPALGTLSALVCLAAYFWTDQMLWLLLAYTGCWLNLFNLIPCLPLDGGKIAPAISEHLWWCGSLLIGGLFFYTHGLLLVLIFLFALHRLWRGAARPEDEAYYRLSGPQRARLLAWYLGLVTVLGAATWYIADLLC